MHSPTAATATQGGRSSANTDLSMKRPSGTRFLAILTIAPEMSTPRTSYPASKSSRDKGPLPQHRSTTSSRPRPPR